jgi:anti-sigma factor RsiW
MTGSATYHVDDGDLVRLLDGELDPPAAAAIRDHLAACDDCARTHDRLARRSESLAGMLDASAATLDPPPVAEGSPGAAAPRRGRPSAVADENRPARDRGLMRSAGRTGAVTREGRSRWWRVAAAVALLLGAGLLAPPVRAWVADRIDDVRERIVGEPPGEPTGADAAGATVLRLPAPGPRLVVESTRPGARSVLVVRRVAGEEAVLEVPGPGATVVVLQDGFRLEEGAEGLEYLLGAPSSVERIVLRPADGEPAARARDFAVTDEPLRIRLGRPD